MYLTLITLSLPTELGLRVVNRVSFTALTAHEIWIIRLISRILIEITVREVRERY